MHTYVASDQHWVMSCLHRRRGRLLLLLLLLSAAVILGLLTSPISADDNILYSGDYLYPGQYLWNGDYQLILQEDCNFVLYDRGRAVWGSGTDGRASYCYVRMQSDGNLVIYSNVGRPLWASNTDRGNGFYVLILQDDRNVVIYGGGVVWATASNAYAGAAAVVAVNGGLAANGTSPFGSVAAVVNAAGGGTVELGRKIRMATAKGVHG
uniref:Lectin 3 n=1 Tax=Arisaema heterophyllum TaxID=227498 RepID=A0A858C2Q8_9ARAE|nr:lectin 3 [Arisaema heterophyllum]